MVHFGTGLRRPTTPLSTSSKAVEIGPAGNLLSAGPLGWLTRSEEPGTSDLTIRARGTAARFLLFADQPLREPIAFGGPFVMNTQAEIQQAFADYRAGRF